MLDVDGVLTDGRLFYGPKGELLKAFHVRDGHGIKQVAAAGITVAIISGRKSAAVVRRARKDSAFATSRRARPTNSRRCASSRKRAVCRSKNAPASATTRPTRRSSQRPESAIAVADAHQDALAVADLVTTRAGGHGAVREVCDWLIAARKASS